MENSRANNWVRIVVYLTYELQATKTAGSLIRVLTCCSQGTRVERQGAIISQPIGMCGRIGLLSLLYTSTAITPNRIDVRVP